MRRNRRVQGILILVLCFVISGLTLGFASFSNSLTISSSALVKPNSSSFNINVYGIGDNSVYSSWDNVESYTSTTSSFPDLAYAFEKAPAATITDDGKDITISNLNVAFSEPGQTAAYYFLIKNEGQYDAYLNLLPLEELFFGVNGNCTGLPGTTPSTVNDACPYILLSAYTYDSEFYEFVFNGSHYKLEKGDYIYLLLYIEYVSTPGTKRADGDFNVEFNDITFDFTSVPPED